MTYDSLGNVRVKTYAASRALPIEGVAVKIYGTDEYNKDTVVSLITDQNGITEEIALPAPSKLYSTSPGAPESPYSVYTFELAKEGFYSKVISNVPIFGGTNAMLPIEMIPLNRFEDGSVIPQTNLNSTIYENENLE